MSEQTLLFWCSCWAECRPEKDHTVPTISLLLFLQQNLHSLLLLNPPNPPKNLRFFHNLCFILPQSSKCGKTATDILLSFLIQQNIPWWLHSLCVLNTAWIVLKEEMRFVCLGHLSLLPAFQDPSFSHLIPLCWLGELIRAGVAKVKLRNEL